VFDEIKSRLLSLRATDIRLAEDIRPNYADDSLVRVSLGSRSCSVLAAGFLLALKRLPDAAGTPAVQVVLEDAAARAEAWAFA
jgi:hypothetical protein